MCRRVCDEYGNLLLVLTVHMLKVLKFLHTNPNVLNLFFVNRMIKKHFFFEAEFVRFKIILFYYNNNLFVTIAAACL